MIETRRRVAEVANKYGKFAATVGSPDNLQELIDMGYHFVSVGADVVGVKNYCQQLLAAFGKHTSNGKSYLEQ